MLTRTVGRVPRRLVLAAVLLVLLFGLLIFVDELVARVALAACGVIVALFVVWPRPQEPELDDPDDSATVMPEAVKNAFLIAISHELRTPLTALVGFTTILEAGGLPPERQVEVVQRIGTSTRRLEKLLLDLLDVERLSRGAVEPNRRTIGLYELVARTIEHTRATAGVHVQIPPDITADVDAALLERVVENLVANASQHTPDGTEVWIRAERDANGVVLIVEDNGQGVPDDLKRSIFEAFSQGEVPEHSPGTGIGLALVNQFARQHGGRAWVEDRAGGGASFRVSIPDGPTTDPGST